MTKLRSTMLVMLCLTASLVVVAAAPAAQAADIVNYYGICTPQYGGISAGGNEVEFKTPHQACASVV